MAGYTAQQLGIMAPKGGFQENGWYSGRNYDATTQTFGDPNQNWSAANPDKTQSQVAPAVVAAGDAAQGLKPGTNEAYLAAETAKQNANPALAGGGTPGTTPGANLSGTPSVDLSSFGGGATAAPALNLPDLYKSLSDSAGITDLEAELTTKEQAFNTAQMKINDNPWLSEASRTGRVSKLQTDYNNDIKTTQDTLAMKKQDIQTQIDLQTKQFDINSSTAKAALDEFNTLLSSGALAGASGNDIAQITKATGISSSEIQAAIASQTQKDTPTAVQTVDDGKNIYSVVINSKTGAIVSKQVIGTSKPAAASTKEATAMDYVSWAKSDAAAGKTLDDMMAYYTGYMTKQQIFDIYIAQNYYKNTPTQITAAQKQYGITVPNATSTSTFQ